MFRIHGLISQTEDKFYTTYPTLKKLIDNNDTEISNLKCEINEERESYQTKFRDIRQTIIDNLLSNGVNAYVFNVYVGYDEFSVRFDIEKRFEGTLKELKASEDAGSYMNSSEFESFLRGIYENWKVISQEYLNSTLVKYNQEKIEKLIQEVIELASTNFIDFVWNMHIIPYQNLTLLKENMTNNGIGKVWLPVLKCLKTGSPVDLHNYMYEFNKQFYWSNY